MLETIKRWWRSLLCRHPVELVSVDKVWKFGLGPRDVWHYKCETCGKDFYW